MALHCLFVHCPGAMCQPSDAPGIQHVLHARQLGHPGGNAVAEWPGSWAAQQRLCAHNLVIQQQLHFLAAVALEDEAAGGLVWQLLELDGCPVSLRTRWLDGGGAQPTAAQSDVALG